MVLVVYVFYEFKAESTHAVAYLYRGAVGSLFAGYYGALWLHGEVYEAVAESGAEPEGAYQLFVKQFEEKIFSPQQKRNTGCFNCHSERRCPSTQYSMLAAESAMLTRRITAGRPSARI